VEQSVDDLGDTARVNMFEQVLNDLVLIGNDVWDDLLLFSINEELNDFAEVASEDGVNRLVVFSIQEFEQAL